MKFGGSRDFDRVSLATFQRLQERLGAADANLVDHVAEVVSRTREQWPEHAHLLDASPVLQQAVEQSIKARITTLLRTRQR